jgi:hypothetical protein
MLFHITLLNLAILGVSIPPAQSAAVPAADLIARHQWDEEIPRLRRAETESDMHVYRRDEDDNLHVCRRDEDDNLHVYRRDEDDNLHVYRRDEDDNL